jgi:hypothetical protein
MDVNDQTVLRQVWDAVQAGKILPSKAMAALRAAGWTEWEAGERIFLALGGGDTTRYDENGVLVFCHSGKPVAEVDALMKK